MLAYTGAQLWAVKMEAIASCDFNVELLLHFKVFCVYVVVCSLLPGR